MTNVIRRRLRATTAGEEGTALVLALLVVLLVGTMLAAVLDFVGVGFRIAPAARESRNQMNYLQGATEGAINNIRGSSTAGSLGKTCPPFTSTAPNTLTGASGVYTVKCTPKTPTAGASTDTTPDFAILTLGAKPDGIRQISGNNTLSIAGGIYSHGVITVTAGNQNAMNVNGSAVAEDACTGPLTSTDLAFPTGHCTYTGDSASAGDPNYLSMVPLTADLANLIASSGADPKPSCGPGSSVVTFTEGYYSLSPRELADAQGCSQNKYVFTAGRYVFNYTQPWNLSSPQAVKVVGGTPKDRSGDNPAGLVDDCDSAQPGVQFIFGGSATLTTGGTNASLALCGPTTGQFDAALSTQSVTGPARYIVVYGLSQQTGAAPLQELGTVAADNHGASDPPLTLAETAAVAAVSGADTAGNAFLNPDGARTIDGSVALTFDPLNPPVSGSGVAAAPLSQNSVSTLNYSAFEDMPPGGQVTSVKVRVRHLVTNGSTTFTLKTKNASGATVSVGSTFSVPDSCTGPTGCDVTVPLTSFPSGPLWKAVNDLTLAYKTDGPSANAAVGTDVVDGVQLAVNYSQPSLTKQACGSGCTFFDSTNNANVHMRGTVYTPAVSWTVEVHNVGDTLFNRGVITRDLAINMSASSKQEGAPFRLDRGGRGRRVLFEGWAPGDSLSGPPRLRACVDYNDTAPTGTTTMAYYGWGVTVQKWNPLRAPSSGDSCIGVP